MVNPNTTMEKTTACHVLSDAKNALMLPEFALNAQQLSL